jgi:hypothetical protein
MIFEAIGATDDDLKLALDYMGVEYVGERTLNEYEVRNETMIICRTKDNISFAQIDILFRRKFEYHISNTFLQTLLLVLIAYMTYFFEVDNFQDKIMVVLTTMLVIATLQSSNQEVCLLAKYNYNNICIFNNVSEPTQDSILQDDRHLVHVFSQCFHCFFCVPYLCWIPSGKKEVLAQAWFEYCQETKLC